MLEQPGHFTFTFGPAFSVGNRRVRRQRGHKTVTASLLAFGEIIRNGTLAGGERFRVRFETTKGPFVVEVRREWAPGGADRFYSLVGLGYDDGVTFFRVIEDFMVQFGIHGDPEVSAAWRYATIPDDPVTQSNKRGMVTFATSGPDTRTTQLFINIKTARIVEPASPEAP